MRASPPRRATGLVLTSLVAASLSAAAAAALEVRTYVDRDNNPATGCAAVTTAGALTGMELLLVATVDTSVNPHVVTALTRHQCSGGAFGAAIPVDTPYPSPWGVGDRNGGDDADVVEMYVPRSALAGASTARLAFATVQDASADALLTTGGGALDPPILLQVNLPVPALSMIAAVLLALLIAVGGALSRRPGAAPIALLLLLGAAGVAWAAVVLDGNPADWQAMACCANDPVGDAGAGADIAAAHACVEGDVVYLRLDVGRNAAPLAVDDQVATDEEAVLNGSVLAANPTFPDSDADLDALTVVAINGSAGAVGVATTLASGAVVTVGADGSFTYDPNGAFASLCPGGTATDSFTYTVSDGHGGSGTATVTVTVNGLESAAVDIEKLVNGDDADLQPGPSIDVGQQVAWTYVVTNTGAVALNGIAVTDNRGVAVTCPKTSLQPGESMTCTANGVASAGQYSNLGTVTGDTPCSGTVTDSDPAHYFGASHPALGVWKMVNSEDANTPPGPSIRLGDPVQWTYLVENTGDVSLSQVFVTDDRGVAVTCPKTILAPGEAMTCTGSGTAVAGQYRNVGTAIGTPPSGPAVTATDPAHYLGIMPSIHIEKLVNGQDADTPPGPTMIVGASLTWSYVVTNTGDVQLTQVGVTDDRGVVVTCPKTALAPGESMTCTGAGTATAGQYVNVGAAIGTAPVGPPVTASDPANYFGTVGQGCTPSYWRNHTDSWPPTGYSPTQKVSTAFVNVTTYYPTLGNATLLQALGFAGGSGNEGAAEILLRAGVGALLNAVHPDVAYPRTPASVIADINTALASNSRDTMLALAAMLDADNNLGCPLT